VFNLVSHPGQTGTNTQEWVFGISLPTTFEEFFGDDFRWEWSRLQNHHDRCLEGQGFIGIFPGDPCLLFLLGCLWWFLWEGWGVNLVMTWDLLLVLFEWGEVVVWVQGSRSVNLTDCQENVFEGFVVLLYFPEEKVSDLLKFLSGVHSISLSIVVHFW